MATAHEDSCSVCTNAFNTSRCQSESLPCGHDLCLSCLVRLNASGHRRCPTCRRNWVGFEVSALPEMETALAAAMQADQEGDGSMPKKKGMFDSCEKHSRDYEYWAIDIEEFYCGKCVAVNPPTKLELVEDVIPQIRTAIAADVTNAKKEVENFLESLDEAHAELVRKRNTLRGFIKATHTLDDGFKQEIENVALVRLEALNSASDLYNMKRKLNAFKTLADINEAVECKSTLKKVAAHSCVPTSSLPKTLLFNIAFSYVGDAPQANPPSKGSFVYAVLKYGTKFSPETVLEAEMLKGSRMWTVDSNNCEAALLALADRQPSVLSLVARDDSCNALPVAAVANAAKGCEAWAKFVDTFYSAGKTANDLERLMDLTVNQSLNLTVFYGHLGHSDIAKLPRTITSLGLAIGSAADTAAVSGLRAWEGLTTLCVSVNSRVTAEDLKPLPNVEYKRLFFPFLSDAGVDSVRPAIEALAPDLRIWSLHFPKSVLTADGARRLAQRLQTVTITDCVTIEASGAWRPRAWEKESVEAELCHATGCWGVAWDMEWIYD